MPLENHAPFAKSLQEGESHGKITVIQTGSTLVSPAVPNRNTRKSPLAYTGLFQRRSNRIEVPVKCFLVEVAGRKTLIDAGWSAQDPTHPLRHMGFGLWFASQPAMEVDEAVDRQLAHLGAAVDDLEAVAFTHLDCDHVSGIDGVAKARRLYVSREELEQALLWVHDLLEDDRCDGAYATHDPAVAPGVYEF